MQQIFVVMLLILLMTTVLVRVCGRQLHDSWHYHFIIFVAVY